MTYTWGMSAALTDMPAQRTEAQVIQEMAELTVKLTMLEFELKRIRNPNGLTMADVRGIWAGRDTPAEEIDAAKLRFRVDAPAST